MKRLPLVALLALAVVVCNAQKVDLDKFNFTFDYRDLPSNPLNPEFKTFSSAFSLSASIRNQYDDTGLEEMVNIDGWKRISGAPGHLIIGVQMEDLMITSSQIVERIDIQKDKDGKETSRKYYYKATAGYTWAGKAAIKDHKETAINTYSMGSTTPKEWASSEYGSRKEAMEYYNMNKSEIKGQLLRQEVTAGLSALSSWMSNNYGYPTRREAEVLWILDSKKHPEYPTQKEAWDKFKPSVAAVNANEMPASTKQTFEELLKYFDSIVAKYPADEKADKKMRYASFYNKAKIYLYLDQPENAIKEADALIANDYDPGDGKRIKKEAEALIEAFKKNNASSRHFPIDVSAYQPPAAN
jgi:hypothetical protein